MTKVPSTAFKPGSERARRRHVPAWDFEDWRQRVAVHEAGHVVSHLAGGCFGIRGAELFEDRGYVKVDPRWSHRIRAQNFYAGAAAEVVHGFTPYTVGEEDRREAERWASVMGVAVDPREALHAAFQELDTPEARAQVEAVALALLGRGRLSGPECVKLVREAVVDG